jgi:hypothetical protein
VKPAVIARAIKTALRIGIAHKRYYTPARREQIFHQPKTDHARRVRRAKNYFRLNSFSYFPRNLARFPEIIEYFRLIWHVHMMPIAVVLVNQFLPGSSWVKIKLSTEEQDANPVVFEATQTPVGGFDALFFRVQFLRSPRW